jgi:hypothetical protein
MSDDSRLDRALRRVERLQWAVIGACWLQTMLIAGTAFALLRMGH